VNVPWTFAPVECEKKDIREKIRGARDNSTSDSLAGRERGYRKMEARASLIPHFRIATKYMLPSTVLDVILKLAIQNVPFFP
jgi:hypothetical protein